MEKYENDKKELAARAAPVADRRPCVHGYLRVSTLEQAKGASLAEQERKIKAAAQLHGLVEPRLWRDRVSGSMPLATRPAGKAMFAKLQSGDIVIAAKLDRAFRNARDALNVVEQLHNRGVDFILLDISVEVPRRSAVGTLLLTVLAAMAEFERTIIQERHEEGKANKRARGGYAGGTLPLGWKVEGRGRDAKVVPNEREREYLEAARAGWQAGKPYNVIADELSAARYTNRLGKRIRYASVRGWHLKAIAAGEVSLSQQIEHGLAERKRKGHRIGSGSHGTISATALMAAAVVRARADQFAEKILPIIDQIEAAGITTYRGIAIALSARGIKTSRGGDWYPATVRTLLMRAQRLNPDARPPRPTDYHEMRLRRQSKVMSLNEKGLDISAIARRVGVGNGYVSDIINGRLRAKPGTITPQQREAAVALYAEGRGLTVRKIAQQTGMSQMSIYRLLHERSLFVSRTPGQPGSITPEQRRDVALLYGRGLSVPMIALQTRLSEPSVRRIVAIVKEQARLAGTQPIGEAETTPPSSTEAEKEGSPVARPWEVDPKIRPWVVFQSPQRPIWAREIARLKSDGKGASTISRELGISRTLVYKFLRLLRPAASEPSPAPSTGADASYRGGRPATAWKHAVQIWAAAARGETRITIAQLFGISRSSVDRILSAPAKAGWRLSDAAD
jgi:putative DNA-invertase from lambdoid prophage Rac